MKALAILTVMMISSVSFANNVICTAQTAVMIDSNGQCAFASNGCEISSLHSEGFKHATVGECELEEPAQPALQSCMQVLLPMLNKETGECVVATNGCQANQLASEGFEISTCNDR